MTLSEALSAIFDDSTRVTRRVWNNRAIYLTTDGRQRLCTTWDSDTGGIDGLLHPWVMSESDYYGDDWEVVE